LASEELFASSGIGFSLWVVCIGLSLMPTAAMWLAGGNSQATDFGSVVDPATMTELST
jgi:xanthine/uracil permease